MKKLIVGLVALCAVVNVLADGRQFTWTGNGGDGKWSNKDNWQTDDSTGWPNATGDHTANYITFNNSEAITIEVDDGATPANTRWANVRTITIAEGAGKVTFTGTGKIAFGGKNDTAIDNKSANAVEFNCPVWINSENDTTVFSGKVAFNGSITGYSGWNKPRIVLVEGAEMLFGADSTAEFTYINLQAGSALTSAGTITAGTLTQSVVDATKTTTLTINGGTFELTGSSKVPFDTDDAKNVNYVINNGVFKAEKCAWFQLTGASTFALNGGKAIITPSSGFRALAKSSPLPSLAINGGTLVEKNLSISGDWAFDTFTVTAGAVYSHSIGSTTGFFGSNWTLPAGFTIGATSDIAPTKTITCAGDLYIDTTDGLDGETARTITIANIVPAANGTVYVKGNGTAILGGRAATASEFKRTKVVNQGSGTIQAASGSVLAAGETAGEYYVCKPGTNQYWWNGEDGANWNDAANWVGGAVPTAKADIVVFWKPGEDEATVNLDTTISCQYIWTAPGAADVKIVGVTGGLFNRSGSGSDVYCLNNSLWEGSQLTLKDITFSNSKAPAAFYGKVIFDNVTYSTGYNNVFYGEFTIDGNSSFAYTGSSNGATQIYSGAKVTINGGAVTFKDTKFIGTSGATKGELIVNGGTVSCTGFWSDEYASGLYAYLTINGGTFTTSAGKAPISNDTMLLHAKVTGGLLSASNATFLQSAYGSSLEITGGEVYAPSASLRTLSKDGNSAFKMSGGLLTIKNIYNDASIYDSYDITGGKVILKSDTLVPTNAGDVPFFNALATQTGFTLETYSAPTFAVGGTYEIDGTLIMTNASSEVVLQGNINGSLTTFRGKGTIVADHVFAGSSRNLEFDGVNLVLNNAAHGVSSYYNIENGNYAATYSNMTFFVGRDNTTGWTIEKNKDSANRYMIINGTVVFNTDNYFDRSTGAYNVYIGAGFRTGKLTAEGYDQAVFFTRGRGTIHYTGYAKSTNMAYVKVIATDSDNVLNLDDSTILPTSGVLSAKTLMIDKDPAITLKTSATDGTAILTDTGWTIVPAALSVVNADGAARSVYLDNGTLKVGTAPTPASKTGWMIFFCTEDE